MSGQQGRAQKEENTMHATELTGVVAAHVAGVNALDTDTIMATFADDAYVNDAAESSPAPTRSAAGWRRK